MELDFQSLFGRLCMQLYSLSEAPSTTPISFGLIYEGAVGQPRQTSLSDPLDQGNKQVNGLAHIWEIIRLTMAKRSRKLQINVRLLVRSQAVHSVQIPGQYYSSGELFLYLFFTSLWPYIYRKTPLVQINSGARHPQIALELYSLTLLWALYLAPWTFIIVSDHVREGRGEGNKYNVHCTYTPGGEGGGEMHGSTGDANTVCDM